jgi:ribosomal protein S27AE
MKCPKCGSMLKKVLVSIWGFHDKAESNQCPKCDYFEFNPEFLKKMRKRRKEPTIKIEDFKKHFKLK